MCAEILEKDLKMMRAAIAEARQALAEGEIPVGAVIECDGRIIGKGHNLTERLNDVTAHAEILAITAAAENTGGKFLNDCTLYVTVEPCLMCAGAIAWSRVGRIVFGTEDIKRGYSGIVCKSPFHPKTEICAGVLQDECRILMQDFFKERR